MFYYFVSQLTGDAMGEMYSYWNDRLPSAKNCLDYVVDKRKSAMAYMTYMFTRLQKMFKYNNLPDTIPREMLEDYLIRGGVCYVTKVNGELYAFQGSFGGEPDPYYRPTLFIVANPALNFNKSLSLWEDGVLMRNNSYWESLVPLCSRYAAMLTENLITIRLADIMLRSVALITAPNDSTKIAADEYLRQLTDGKLGAIAENRFLDGIKLQSPPSNNGSYLTQFIELEQYLKASFYHEIGLNANYNMKREAIGSNESNLNKDSLLPLCEDMLRCRQEDVSRLNSMYGTDISVEFDSAWAQNVLENKLELDALRTGGESGAERSNQSGDEAVSEESQGNSEDNAAGSADSNRGDESESDGSDTSSVRAGGRTEESDDNSTTDDVSGDGEGNQSDVRDEVGDEEIDAEQSDSKVVVNISVSQLIEQGGENDVADDGGDGEGRESGDKDS